MTGCVLDATVRISRVEKAFNACVGAIPSGYRFLSKEIIVRVDEIGLRTRDRCFNFSKSVGFENSRIIIVDCQAHRRRGRHRIYRA